MKYIIVKYAGSQWDTFFLEDPKEAKVHLTYSAYYTHSGKNIAHLYYTDKRLAEKDCTLLNQLNSSGDYAVCALEENSTSKENYASCS